MSKLDVSTIKVRVQVAPNGIDYIDTDDYYTFEGTGGVGVSVWIWIVAIMIGLIVLGLLIWWVILSNRRRDRGLGPLSIVPPQHSELIHRSNKKYSLIICSLFYSPTSINKSLKERKDPYWKLLPIVLPPLARKS